MSAVTVHRYTILGRAPSVNRTPHGHIGARRKHQREVLNPWYESVAVQMTAHHSRHTIEDDTWLLAVAEFHLSGPHRRRDPDNLAKPTQDAVAKALGIDDTRFLSFHPYIVSSRDGATVDKVELQIAFLDSRLHAPRIEDVVETLALKPSSL